MADSDLSIKYADLLAEVAAFLGYGSDPDAWTTEQRAKCDRYVQRGVRRFYFPPAVQGVEAGYSWSFLSPVTTIATVEDEETQELPGGLGRVVGQFHYAASVHHPSIPQLPEDRFQAFKTSSSSSGYPQVACVRHKAKEAGRGQRLEVEWWPVPDAAYTLTYKFEAYSGKLSDDNPYPLGGMKHSELVLESCLSVAEQSGNDERGLHTAEFERLLVAAIEQDRKVGSTHFGPMGDRSEAGAWLPRRGDTGSTHTVSYNGSDIT